MLQVFTNPGRCFASREVQGIESFYFQAESSGIVEAVGPLVTLVSFVVLLSDGRRRNPVVSTSTDALDLLVGAAKKTIGREQKPRGNSSYNHRTVGVSGATIRTTTSQSLPNFIRGPWERGGTELSGGRRTSTRGFLTLQRRREAIAEISRDEVAADLHACREGGARWCRERRRGNRKRPGSFGRNRSRRGGR